MSRRALAEQRPEVGRVWKRLRMRARENASVYAGVLYDADIRRLKGAERALDAAAVAWAKVRP
jgi:hypothetical protein